MWFLELNYTFYSTPKSNIYHIKCHFKKLNVTYINIIEQKRNKTIILLESMQVSDKYFLKLNE